MSRRQLWRAVSVVMGLTVLSRVTGLLREMALAYGLGVSGSSDAYLLAFTVPNLAAAVIGVAAGKALLPPYIAHLAAGREENATRLASTALNAVGLICLALTGAGLLWADQLVAFMAPGFDARAHSEAVAAVKIMLPGLICLCAGSLVTSGLHSNKLFIWPALTPIAQNLVLIVGALLAPVFGLKVLAWVTLGAISLDLLLPLIGFRGRRLRYFMRIDADELLTLGRLALPLMVGSLAYQAVTAVDLLFASTAGEGSIAALNFSERLRQLPVGLFGATAVTVLYPTLAELASTGQVERFRRYLGQGLYALLLVLIPSAIGLMVLRRTIITLLFQHGAFDSAATAATAAALLWHSPGLIGLAATSLLSVGFYSLKDTVTPVMAGLVGAAVQIGLDALLAPPMGHAGIALASSVASLGTAVALYLLLARRLGGLPLRWGAEPGLSLFRRF